jgi:hypothetical protein
VLVLARDAGFQQVIQHGGKGRGGDTVRGVFGQRLGDEAEGVLGLPVGELVRAGRPVLGHAQPPLVGGGQRGQRGMHLSQVRGTAVCLGEHHAQD